MLRSSDTRAQSDSDKWHKYSGRNILPMWIADTEFLAAPAILDALQERLEHGVFGYGHRRQRFLDAIKNTATTNTAGTSKTTGYSRSPASCPD